MSFFYSLKVKSALAKMSVNPRQLDGELRSILLKAGVEVGLTPEETALVIVAHGLGLNHQDATEKTLVIWKREKKIDLSKPELTDALKRMGFGRWGI